MTEDIDYPKPATETYTGALLLDSSDQTDRLSKRHRIPIRNGNNLKVFRRSANLEIV